MHCELWQRQNLAFIENLDKSVEVKLECGIVWRMTFAARLSLADKVIVLTLHRSRSGVGGAERSGAAQGVIISKACYKARIRHCLQPFCRRILPKTRVNCFCKRTNPKECSLGRQSVVGCDLATFCVLVDNFNICNYRFIPYVVTVEFST